jgi:DNA recombination protein RmuC
MGLMALVAWIFISRRSQRLDDLEKQDSLKDAREQLFGARKENELLAERITKAESLETELRQLLKESENEGARMVAELENLNRRLDEKQKENEESAKFLQEKFENLANKILDQKSTKFTEINKENLKNVLQPLDKDIREFRKKVEDLHEKETSQHAALREFLGNLHESQAKLSEEAHNLTQALKGDSKKQGDWGEFILQRALEASGLNKDQEFSMQSSFDGKRPDAIIHLPGNRQLIIDAKVSLTAYEKSISSQTKDERKKALKEHLQSVRKHIDELSAKDYSSIEEINCPDFTLMFIPVEPAFGAALTQDAELYQYAFDRKIALITASTLMATIKTVANLWKLEKQNKHSQDVAKRAGLLYDKFAGFLVNIEEMGKSLQKAVGAHEKAVGQLSTGPGNLIGQAEKLKAMGVRTKKDLPTGFIDENERDLEPKQQPELSFSKDPTDSDNRQSV